MATRPRPLLVRLGVLTCFFGVSTALAHEFWLEFPSFRLRPGEAARLDLLVGEGFAGEPWTNNPHKVVRLSRYGPTLADSADLTPRDTLRPVVRFAAPGTHLVVLSSADSFIELPGPKFTAYLREEGLEYALRRRHEEGHDSLPGRETYRRRAKTLVQVGEAGTDTTYRRVLGLPLELVPEQNPYRLRTGQALTVRVLRAGKPAAGALVQVWQRQPGGQPTAHFRTRANQNGRLLLRLSGPGPFLLAAVDIAPAPAALHARADWQSTWASLTFAGPAAAGPGGPLRRRLPK